MEQEIYLSLFTIFDYEDTGRSDHVPEAHHVFMAYMFPILACMALIGNSLFVVSIACTNLKNKTTGVLLMSTNICSIVQTIASCFIVYYPWVFEVQPSGTRLPCNILVFVSHGLASWSVYLLTTACVERFIAICYPMSKYSYMSQSASKQSLRLLLGTFIGAMALNVPLIWFSGLTIIEEVPGYGNVTFCYYTKDNWYMNIHEYVEMTVYSIIPFVIICFCNINIIRKVYFHKTLLESFGSHREHVSDSRTNYRLPHGNQAAHMASILLPISVLHLVFSLIVVISILLEDSVAETADAKLVLLTLSYNASQLQAGYYFYANISLSKVYRKTFMNMFKRKTYSTTDSKTILRSTVNGNIADTMIGDSSL